MGQDLRLVPLATAGLVGAWCGFEVHSGATWIFLAGLILIGGACFISAKAPIAMGLIACGIGLATASVTHVHIEAATLEQRAAQGVISGHVVVSGKAIERLTPWGSTECEVQARPLQLESTTNGDIAFTRSVRILLTNVPCDVLIGQVIDFDGTASLLDLRKRESVRIKVVRIHVAGKGTLAARAVSEIDNSLALLLVNHPAHAQALIPGVALGDDSKAPQELTDAMKMTQLTHLLAVSGGHISILTAVLIALFGRRKPRLTALVCLGAIGGLVILVGPEASVIRAVLMGLIVTAALAGARTSQALAALSIAILAAILIDPWLALSYGFLLSVSATAGIVVLGGPIRKKLAEKFPPLIADAIAVPFAAQMSCVPVLMLFSQFGSVWGVLANAIVAPIVAPLTIFGLASALCAPLWPALASGCISVAQLCTWWIANVARTLSNWPGSGLPLLIASFVSALALAGLMWLRPYKAVALGAIVFAVFVLFPRASVIPKDWVVIQCDVGQGSAFLARVGGSVVMVDVGPDPESVSTCVRDAQVETVDVLILSHEHADHVGGLAGVLESVNVGRVIRSPVREPAENATWVDSQLNSAGLTWETGNIETTIAGNDGSEIGSLKWPRVAIGPGTGANEGSVVVELNVAGGVLVMGDTGAEEQDAMLGRIEQANIVVMAHHGSANQSERFARKADPEFTFISVGENAYGHPAPKAERMYEGSKIYATLECGTISMTSNGAIVSKCPDPEGP